MTVLENIKKAPYHYGFYRAMRDLECFYRDRKRLGTSQNPKQEKVRLGQQINPVFAPATLAEAKQEQGNLYLKVWFYGMFGANGALPLHLTEYAQSRKQNAHDEALTDFMDLFHHRLLSLFYRAWANKEPTVNYDRPDSDRFHRYIGSFIGIGSPALRNRDRMPDNSKLYFSGHMGARSKHPEGLASILQAFFNVPVSLEEFIGEWLEISQRSQSSLGIANDGGSLGESSVLGAKSWQRQFKFRVVIGPMNLHEYEDLLPGKNKIELVKTIVRNYLGDELNYDVRLILKREDIPETRLGQYGQLGWTNWLHKQQPENDSGAYIAH